MAEKQVNSIHLIGGDVRHRLCTGQIVVTLAGACKELIENALDADASIIEIRVSSLGTASLEVIDNGIGISSADFSLLGKSHATSKISSFDDLSSLQTLGFRGEALSALCALSSLTIISRSADKKVGTKLTFDHAGNAKSQEVLARPIGTSVIVNNLFETLPVRRKELERSAKKEFAKLLHTVQSFALGRVNVRFIVNNFNNGKLFQTLVTPGDRASVNDVMGSLFGIGPKKNPMLEIERRSPSPEILNLYGISEKLLPIIDQIRSCLRGHGRCSKDRQYVFINKRPVEYAKLCKLVNEIYQTYNPGQYCTLILNIFLHPQMLDVNVSPDKQIVFLQCEKEVFALLRSSFLATFERVRGLTKSMSNVSNSQRTFAKEDDVMTLGGFAAGNIPAKSSSFQSNSIKKCEKNKKVDGISCDLQRSMDGEKVIKRIAEEKLTSSVSGFVRAKRPVPMRLSKEHSFRLFSDSSSVSTNWSNSSKDAHSAVFKDATHSVPLPLFSSSVVQVTAKSDMISLPPSVVVDSALILNEENIASKKSSVTEMGDENFDKNSSISNRNKLHVANIVANSATRRYTRTQQMLKFSMSALYEKIEQSRSRRRLRQKHVDDEIVSEQKPIFIADASSEGETFKYISKSDFNAMKVVGQFNKGFIVVHFHNELFIVDQHASDEIYNFERFQKKAKLQTQKLISPQVLDIGAVKESILRDNIGIFNFNGFDFNFVETAPVGRKAMLVSVPVLHNWQFNTTDLDEMLSVLADFPGVMYRPLKLRKLFASRACRKSVMIGTALSTAQMRKIIRQLACLDQPWNCPHGRPTLRHLCAINCCQ